MSPLSPMLTAMRYLVAFDDLVYCSVMKSPSSFPCALMLLLAVGFSSSSVVYGQAVVGRSGSSRQTIRAKLAAIQLPTFQADNLPLSEVIKNLSDAAKRLDPEKRGINFLLNPTGDLAPTANNQPGVPAPEPVAVAALPVNIPQMTDVSLDEILRAIVKVAGPPYLKYTVEDYAVVIYPTAETVRLYTRKYKLDPNTFQQGLHNVVGVPFGNINVTAGNQGGGGGTGGQAGQNSPVTTVPRVEVSPPQGGIPNVTRTNGTENVQSTVRTFLQSLGVNLTPPKSAFFNDREGTLIVHATLADLELIEGALGR